VLISQLNAGALFAKSDKRKEPTIAITAIFRNEAPYLKEWIEYHKIIGVSKFYLYNNLSQDNYKDVLKPYIKSREVELVEWPHKYIDGQHGEWIQIQIRAYQDALKKAKGSAISWLAMLDIDEFIVPVKEKSLSHLLKKVSKKSGGIAARWVFFGTSNVSKIPSNKTLIETLTLNEGNFAKKDDNTTWTSGSYKSIGRVDRIASIPSPHYFLYQAGTAHYLESLDNLQINHYWTRDEEYFNKIKVPSRLARGHAQPQIGNKNKFFEPFGKPILRFVPALRKHMGLSK
jgi:hypothetical protein